MWLGWSHGRERAQTHHMSRLLRSHMLVMNKHLLSQQWYHLFRWRKVKTPHSWHSWKSYPLYLCPGLQHCSLVCEEKMLWNVYCCSPPELSLYDFLSWANIVRSTEFISEDYGRGTACTGDKQFVCFGCKSLNHPAGLCPFTELPGWFGPTAKSADPNERCESKCGFGSEQ